MTWYDLVKESNGLTNHEAIHRLCNDVKTYMIKNKITEITPYVVRATMRIRKRQGGTI